MLFCIVKNLNTSPIKVVHDNINFWLDIMTQNASWIGTKTEFEGVTFSCLKSWIVLTHCHWSNCFHGWVVSFSRCSNQAIWCFWPFRSPNQINYSIAQESTHKVVNIINPIKPASILQRKAVKATALKGMQIAFLLLWESTEFYFTVPMTKAFFFLVFQNKVSL